MVDLHKYPSKMLTALSSISTHHVVKEHFKQSKECPQEVAKCVCRNHTHWTIAFYWLLLDLEISKPQKNSRNAAASAAGDSLRAGNKRRSRSPDYGRGSQRTGGQRNGADRYGSNGNSRVEARRRDDYRPMRSPSPRGFRGRDDYYGPRGRSPDRYYGGRRSRSRSPYNRHGRYRSRSPQDLDDEASLPFPRRDVRDIPDVQIILIDQVDR